MSGGSFNYLYAVDGPDLLMSHADDLRDMRGELATYAGSEAAVRQTDALLAMIDRSRRELYDLKESLNGVFRAVEWDRSCDGTAEDVTKALAAFARAAEEAPPVGLVPTDGRPSLVPANDAIEEAAEQRVAEARASLPPQATR